MDILQVKQLSQDLKLNIKKVIKGKDDVIKKVIICMLCNGHILLEDIPGTGKTTLAKALAKSINCDFKRVQFTPDLLPSDLTGINFYNQKQGDFVFKQGSIFTNILLGDEINRATPRTQSSLLECMEEGQVSVDGKTYILDKPFLVVATQNPIEIQGTFPLPEAQLDRFFMKLSVGYPDNQSEKDMLKGIMISHPVNSIQNIVNKEDILQSQQCVKQVKVSDAICEYIVKIVTATRQNEKVKLGVSPRGTIALMNACKANAAINGRDYVLPDDVKEVCVDVLAHRIICKGFNITQSSNVSAELVKDIVNKTEVPVE
ncbi:MAG: MoxR family ATPase [Oscillospiraceae bacterium]